MPATHEKAVIFDLDGTLLDTLDDLADSMNTTLAASGFATHPVSDYKTFIGEGVRILAERVLPPDARDDATVTRLLEDYLEVYRRNYRQKSRPYSGIPELLDALTARRIRLAIFSNKPQAPTEACVREMLSPWHFDIVLGAGNGFPRKPDPKGALHIATQWQLPPTDCLFLGDSGIDMETASNARMLAVGVLWGFREEEELRRSGARKIVSSPQEVLHILNEDASSTAPAPDQT